MRAFGVLAQSASVIGCYWQLGARDVRGCECSALLVVVGGIVLGGVCEWKFP